MAVSNNYRNTMIRKILLCLLILSSVIDRATPSIDNEVIQHHLEVTKQEYAILKPFHHVYPWSMSHYNDRQSSILEDLRDRMNLDISIDILPEKIVTSLEETKEVYSPMAYIIRNVETDVYYASLYSSGRDKHDKERQKRLLREKGEDPRGGGGYLRDNNKLNGEIDLTNEKEILSTFSTKCSYLQTGFWNYEWCHLREVRQFHLRQPENPTQSDPRHPHHVQGVRDPDWSLGKYHSTKMIRKGGVDTNTSAPIVKMLSLFKDGQYCDENGHKRSTEVHVKCCPEVLVNNIPGNNNNHNNNNNKQVSNKGYAPVFIKTVAEPDICKYKIDVCSEVLCESTESITEQSKVTFQSLTAIFKELENRCIVKSEEWWTYEFCFKTGLRQMHLVVESTKQVDNAIIKTQTIEVQYSLGLVPLHAYTNESLLSSLITNNRHENKTKLPDTTHTDADADTERSNNKDNKADSTPLDRVYSYVGLPSNVLLGRKKKPDALVLELTNGTVCDLKNGAQRTSTVHLYCGDREMISEIIESRTCHYDVVVYVHELCKYSALTPRTTAYSQLRFIDALEYDVRGERPKIIEVRNNLQ